MLTFPKQETNTIKNPLFTQMLVAGSSACITDALTYPIDTVKVRIQIKGEWIIKQLSPKYNGCLTKHMQATPLPGRKIQSQDCGIIKVMKQITHNEGSKALYSGLFVGLRRQMIFTSFRLGTYDTTTSVYEKIFNSPADPFGWKPQLFTAVTAGPIGVFIGHPSELVRIRMQAYRRLKLIPKPPLYTSAIHAYRTIYNEEGLSGLWKGVGPNVGQTTILNVTEIICYDQTKNVLLKYTRLNDNIVCHLFSAIVTGFVASIVSSPIDTLKVRYMNAKPGQYDSAVDCARQLIKYEGPAAFYTCFSTSFLRLVSWNICLWITYEQIKRIFFVEEKSNVN